MSLLGAEPFSIPEPSPITAVPTTIIPTAIATMLPIEEITEEAVVPVVTSTVPEPETTEETP